MNDNSYNKDIIMMVLAVIGLVVIIIVFIRNRIDGNWNNKDFMAEAYYELPDKIDGDINEVAIYNQVKNRKSDTACPQPALKTTARGRVALTAQGNLYMHDMWLADSYSVNGSNNTVAVIARTTDADAVVKVREAIGLSTNDDIWAGTGEDGTKVFSCYAMSSDDMCSEIIAPFYFNFDNMNTSKEKEIVIVNKAGTLRITFGSVVNWFCAGPYDGTKEWSSHGTNSSETSIDNRHKTIVGNTANAEVSGGSPGQVIGYADAETTVLIEKLDGGRWTPISIEEWIMGTK